MCATLPAFFLAVTQLSMFAVSAVHVP